MHLWMTSQGEQLKHRMEDEHSESGIRDTDFSGANWLFFVFGVVYFLEWFSQKSRFGERC